ncbi:HIT family protein [Serratia fonticola]|uniref:HIT family protein n=1 Tax=Serratia fonticola TaxID=47917 RepID=UPI0035936459
MSYIVYSISSRILDSYIIYESEVVICFFDHMPINDGHILICPKEHYDNIMDLPEDIIF